MSDIVVTHTPGAVKKFRRTSWQFQQTIERPAAKELEQFVSTILKAHGRIIESTLIIDQIVFGSTRMTALCAASGGLDRDWSLMASSLEKTQALLIAAFMDGPDFMLIPTPKPFVFYADHDDWITFFANTKSHLNQVIEPLRQGGYRLIENWKREFK